MFFALAKIAIVDRPWAWSGNNRAPAISYDILEPDLPPPDFRFKEDVLEDPRYYAQTSLRRVAPGQLPGAIGVIIDPKDPMPIGIAFEDGHIGGWDGQRELGPREAVWRLKIGKEEIDGRWVIRDGAFVELGEEAE